MSFSPSPRWRAAWIGPQYDPRQDLGIFAFRTALNLEAVPETYRVRVSADQRYKLVVNGSLVAFGPQRGDIQHWFYETLDLAPLLREGQNQIVALVWNFGWLAPMAQHSIRTGFVLESEAEGDTGISTPGAWEVARVPGWDFEMMFSSEVGSDQHTAELSHFYIDVGPGEIVDGRRYDAALSQAEWKKPHGVYHAEDRGAKSGSTPWNLVPRSIPLMRYDLREARPLARRGFLNDVPSSPFGEGIELGPATELPANTPLLLDYRELLCAYPRLKVSGPEGATVTLIYNEALFRPDRSKGNRDQVEGKSLIGYLDRVVLGSGTTEFEPLWWRTYRYVQIQSDQPVRIESLDAIETGYPYRVDSKFEADDPSVKPLWDVSIRTAERCAGETYFDCPYYEQLQYVGDTRIQALLHYYLSRDRALPRNAVETFSWSIMENGLTQSRYPSRQPQVIPPFSLWWVLMLYDQMLYDDAPHDPFKDEQAHGVIRAWRWLTRNDPERTWWCFGDWQPDWEWGVPPGGALATMHLLTKMMARIACNDVLLGQPFHSRAEFMPELVADIDLYLQGLHTHKRDKIHHPTEHAEALYRCVQLMLGLDPDPWPTEALQKVNASKCSFYFAYYKHLAMQPQDYLAELGPWKEMIEDGLTTFAEIPGPTRSDCHAWSAHPALGFFQHIAGVTSIAAGWRKARIAPRPGSLRRFRAEIAHPVGELVVAFEDGRLTVETPVPAELHWDGKVVELAPGKRSVG